MMTDSNVGGFNHCLAAGGERVSLFLGFDESIGSAGEFRFEFRSEFKNSKLSSVTIHDRNGNARSMDDCISINVRYFSTPLVGYTSLQYAKQ
jgi:hypothetical protein